MPKIKFSYTITYNYTVNAECHFDGVFTTHMTNSLDKIRDRVLSYMSSYGFVCCDVIDSITGEVLMTINAD